MNSSYPSDIVLLVWMKTQPIMIIVTPSEKYAINDFVMESSLLDSITKLFCTDSKTKSSESTSTNYEMESFIGYSRPELFLADYRLEFVAEPKFPIASPEICLLVEFQLFDWSLPKSNGPKILLSLVVPYFGSLMPIIRFFQLTLIFGVV
jgi:hypothetical protein